MWPFKNAEAAAKPAKDAARTRAIDQWSSMELATVAHPEDVEFLSSTAAQITANIQLGKWTASAVLHAYIRSAIRAHKNTNCLTEILFEPALRHAELLDHEFAQTGKLRGRLHGVPMSLKDQIDVQGFDSSIGFSDWCDKPATEDAALVKILKNEGAVIFCKTNVPQTMLSFECSNPVFGATGNPYHPTHTCGGSSGGEAALLASDGSVIGVGSDIGGSLRIPASYSGCFGYKPCYGRIPNQGCQSSARGFEGIRSSMGPMARTVEDLELLMKVFVEGGLEHAAVTGTYPIPWRVVALPEKLRFGYYKNDAFAKASPACQRAVQESVDALRKAGHQCIEFEPPSTLEAMKIFVALTSADGYARLMAGIGSDPVDESLFLIRLNQHLGPTLLSVAGAATSRSDPIAGGVMSAAGVKSVYTTLGWQEMRNDYVQKFRKQVWETYKFDGIICPTQATPAIPKGSVWNLSFLAIGTILYNVVDSSVGCVPVTFVDPVKDALTPEWEQSGGPSGSPIIEALLYGKQGKLGEGIYQPNGTMKGLPVGVQVVGPAYEDEKVLKMCKVLDDALGERNFGAGCFARREN